MFKVAGNFKEFSNKHTNCLCSLAVQAKDTAAIFQREKSESVIRSLSEMEKNNKRMTRLFSKAINSESDS